MGVFGLLLRHPTRACRLVQLRLQARPVHHLRDRPAVPRQLRRGVRRGLSLDLHQHAADRDRRRAAHSADRHSLRVLACGEEQSATSTVVSRVDHRAFLHQFPRPHDRLADHPRAVGLVVERDAERGIRRTRHPLHACRRPDRRRLQLPAADDLPALRRDGPGRTLAPGGQP